VTDTARDVLAASDMEDQRSAFDLGTHRRPFVTAIELAGWLRVERRTIVRMIKQGSLPAVKAGRCWRIPTDAARRAFHVEQIPA
jgi:excisionase family DNA binding protein